LAAENRTEKTEFDYGAASSPVVHDGQVIVVYDNLEASWIAAFDAQTGNERWRTPRDETRSWATPLVWTNPIRTEIVVPGENRNRGYSLDGKLLWEFDGRMGKLVIPSPFAAHGLCYISSGFVAETHRPTFALRPGASGNIAADGDFENSQFIAWYQDRSGSYNPSQIVYGDYLYTLYDQGFLTCHDAKSGEEVYGRQRFSPSGSFTASPFAFNGRLFCLSEDGLTYVVKPGPEFEILQTQSPRRTLPLQSRHRRRQAAHSDGIQAVLPDRGRRTGRRQLWGIQVAPFLYNGCSLNDKNFVSMYRWHLPDPIAWQKEARITIQQIAMPRGGGKLTETQDDWSTATFWYEPVPSAKLPPMPDLKARTADIWKD
jgi:hypothetical protein